MDNQKIIRKGLRHEFSSSGWLLLLYWGIMSTAVTLVSVVEVLFRVFRHGIPGPEVNARIPELISQVMSQNGWGYILSGLLGFLAILLWKGPKFVRQEIFARKRAMTLTSLLTLVCLMIAEQFLSQILFLIQELMLNTLGLSMDNMMEAASVNTDSLSMFLYAGVAAPVAEELLFRGALLRSLSRHGKKFAILTTSFLFAIFHGNLIQAPFAFLAGVILGYTAMEYSILWSMVLHMFNNMIIADLLNRVSRLIPGLIDVLWLALMAGCLILSLVYLVQKRKKVAARWMEDRLDSQACLCFFTSPGVVVIMVIMWLQMASSMLLLLL